VDNSARLLQEIAYNYQSDLRSMDEDQLRKYVHDLTVFLLVFQYEIKPVADKAKGKIEQIAKVLGGINDD